MFSPEFEQVYKEAYTSATGGSFEDVQAEHDAYTAPLQDELLSYWADPANSVNVAIPEYITDRDAAVFRVRHPSTAEFDTEDAANIAHVRFLGRAIIDIAKKFAPPIGNDYDRNLSYRYWLDANGQPELDPSHSFDQDASSPLRLEGWPISPISNCLGISIALSAQQERDTENAYYYMNRLRHSSYVSNLHYLSGIEELRRMQPLIFNNMLSTLMIEGGWSLEEATEIQKTSIEKHAHVDVVTVDPNFHHAIVAQNSSAFARWTQEDPYGAVIDGISPYGIDKKLDEIIEEKGLGAFNEIIVVDNDVLDFSYQSKLEVIHGLQDWKVRLIEAAHGNYKSEHYFENVYERYTQLYKAAAFGELLKDGLSEQHWTVDRFLDHSDKYGIDMSDESDAYWSLELWKMRLKFYGNLHEDEKEDTRIWRLLFGMGSKSKQLKLRPRNKDLKEVIQILQDSMKEDVKYDSRLRKHFVETIEMAPYVFGLGALYQHINLEAGMSDQALEIADPAFMIGSMYLNHYARWREDGTVNVAKELARINPSQLIWQSAVAGSSDALEDDRVRSLGKLIKGFKYDQIHPLVRITLPLLKE